MIAVAIAALPIFFSGHRVAGWEDALFLAYYVASTLYLVIHAADHPLLPAFRTAMLVFVIPVTVLALVLGAARSGGSSDIGDRPRGRTD